MAHSFDTGLSRPQRTLVREGIVQLLSGLVRANGGYVAAVLPWAGVVRGWQDSEGIDNLLALLNGRAPAIVVGLGDGNKTPAGMGGFNYKMDIEVTLYHFSNHARSLTEGRVSADARALADDTRDPGLDVMMEHAEELLGGIRVGKAPVTNPVGEVDRSIPGIHMISPDREEEIATDETHTIWAQRFKVTVSRKLDRFRTVTELLASLATTIRPTDQSGEPVTPVVTFGNTIP